MIRSILAVSVLLMAASPAFASDHCDCSKKCMSQCEKGDHKNCKCSHCDCAKGGKCSDGKCNMKEEAKKPDAK